MSRSKRLSQAMSYPAFMQRLRVLGLYRAMLKSVQIIERQDIREDLLKQIKSEFLMNRNVKDPVAIRNLMSEGSRQLEMLKDMASPSKDNHKSKVPLNHTSSWLDSSTEGDIKGRVGTGWPWQT